jgi:hypothetical protein
MEARMIGNLDEIPGLVPLPVVCTGRDGVKHRKVTQFGFVAAILPERVGPADRHFDENMMVFSIWTPDGTRNMSVYQPGFDVVPLSLAGEPAPDLETAWPEGFDPYHARARYRCRRCGTDFQRRVDPLRELVRDAVRVGILRLDISARTASLFAKTVTAAV